MGWTGSKPWEVLPGRNEKGSLLFSQAEEPGDREVLN